MAIAAATSALCPRFPSQDSANLLSAVVVHLVRVRAAVGGGCDSREVRVRRDA